MPTPLLSAFYFGTVEHFRLLAQHERVVIDLGEHYERQSYRTRTRILGPNGVQDLVVPISRRSGEKIPMREVALSYDETWPQQHLHAIRSAYGKTPWYIHFIDDIESVVMQRYERLADLDLATMRLGMRWLGLGTELMLRDTYVEEGILRSGPLTDVVGATESGLKLVDLRTAFHPKKELPNPVEAVAAYPQVFSDRGGPVPRMSIIDLVCNCGPKAVLHLRR